MQGEYLIGCFSTSATSRSFMSWSAGRLVAGRLPEAIDEFKKAIALNPSLARVHDNLALAYLMNEGASRLDNAEREFKTELVSNPDEFFANYYLGIVYIFQRKWDLAIAFLKNASSGKMHMFAL